MNGFFFPLSVPGFNRKEETAQSFVNQDVFRSRVYAYRCSQYLFPLSRIAYVSLFIIKAREITANGSLQHSRRDRLVVFISCNVLFFSLFILVDIPKKEGKFGKFSLFARREQSR